MPSDGMPAPGASGAAAGAGDRLLRNTLANVVGRFWAIGLTLVLTPYIVSRVGLERFGLWSLISVLTGYVALLDFGLGTAFIKRLAEYRARGDGKRINETVATGFAAHLAIGVVTGVAALLFAGAITRLLDVPPPLVAEARVVLGWGLVLFTVGNASSVFPSLVVACQRMDLTNRIAIVITVPQAIATVLVLEAGWGLRGLLLVQALVTLAGVGANVVVAHQLVPGLGLSPRWVRWRAYRDLMSFGMKLQAVKISDILTFQTDRLILARFWGMAPVGFYQLGSMVAVKVRQMPLLLTSAVLPLASELSTLGERERLVSLYERGTRYLVAVGLPLSAAAAVLARPLFRAWMGAGYEASATILQILAAGYFANMMHGQAVLIGAALDRPGLHTRSAALTAVVNVILSVALGLTFGYVGIAVATTIALVLGPLYYLPLFHRLLGTPLGPFFRRLFIAPVIATAAASAAAALAARAAGALPIGAVRLAGIAETVAGSIVFAALYVIILWRLGYVTVADRELAARAIRFGLNAPADLAGAGSGR